LTNQGDNDQEENLSDELGRLKAERYTTANRLSSVRTRLKGNHSDERRRELEARRDELEAKRMRLTAEIKVRQGPSE
jgi:hypothetical protein